MQQLRGERVEAVDVTELRHWLNSISAFGKSEVRLRLHVNDITRTFTNNMKLALTAQSLVGGIYRV